MKKMKDSVLLFLSCLLSLSYSQHSFSACYQWSEGDECSGNNDKGSAVISPVVIGQGINDKKIPKLIVTPPSPGGQSQEVLNKLRAGNDAKSIKEPGKDAIVIPPSSVFERE